MVTTDTEYPPVSGTALRTAITDFDLNAAIAVITSAVVLSLAHNFFKPCLAELYH